MLILKSIEYALIAHRDQLRKYPPDEPYIFHPINVALILSTITNDENIIAGGVLHDVLEDDPNTTSNILLTLFGENVMQYVSDVTDVSKLSDGNRKVRKQIDLKHLATVQPNSKTIKLADIIDNGRSIRQYNRGFARKWLGEKQQLLPYLVEGNARLYKLASDIINKP